MLWITLCSDRQKKEQTKTPSSKTNLVKTNNLSVCINMAIRLIMTRGPGAAILVDGRACQDRSED